MSCGSCKTALTSDQLTPSKFQIDTNGKNQSYAKEGGGQEDPNGLKPEYRCTQGRLPSTSGPPVLEKVSPPMQEDLPTPSELESRVEEERG